jgi:lipopolysaccharide/colanic/teichoic acid biosynthesis glycosyltransferase
MTHPTSLQLDFARPAAEDFSWQAPVLSEAIATDIQTTTPETQYLIDLLESSFCAHRLAYSKTKRIVDVVGGVLLLIMTAPIILIAALLVMVTSNGPIIFASSHPGLYGRQFILFKFRTMVSQTHRRVMTGPRRPKGVHSNSDDEMRVTRVGRILTRLGIDELPQLINVLRGEMSLVGPSLDRDEHRTADGGPDRLAVRPGLPGMWQF